MLGIHDAAVGDGKEKCLAKVKTSVPSQRWPKIPGSAQCKSKNQSGNCDVGLSNYSFAWVSSVHKPEKDRKQDCRRPESNASRQGVLDISPKQKLFREPHKDEGHGPKHSPAHKAGSVHGESAERISAKCRNQGHEHCHFSEPKQNTLPELLPECMLYVQTV